MNLQKAFDLVPRKKLGKCLEREYRTSENVLKRKNAFHFNVYIIEEFRIIVELSDK